MTGPRTHGVPGADEIEAIRWRCAMDTARRQAFQSEYRAAARNYRAQQTSRKALEAPQSESGPAPA